MMPVQLNAQTLFMRNVAYRLRQARLQLGLTQTRVSADTGLCDKCIIEAEGGYHLCHLETYNKLIDRYGLSKDILHTTYTSVPTPQQHAELNHIQDLLHRYHHAKQNKPLYADKLKSLCFLTVDLTKPRNEPGVQLELMLVEREGKAKRKKK